MRPRFLAVGKVKSAHGVKGEIKVSLLTDYPAKFKPGFRVYISSQAEKGKRPLIVEKVRFSKDAVIVKFQGMDNRKEAQSLKGCLLEIPVEEAESLPEGTYWHYQIIGLSVYTTEEKFLGKISDILRTGSNDVYRVRPVGEGKEILIPAIKEVVKKVDLKAGRMVIEPLPGLLE